MLSFRMRSKLRCYQLKIDFCRCELLHEPRGDHRAEAYGEYLEDGGVEAPLGAGSESQRARRRQRGREGLEMVNRYQNGSERVPVSSHLNVTGPRKTGRVTKKKTKAHL